MIGSEIMSRLPYNSKISKHLDEAANEYRELLYNALINKSDGIDKLSVTELIKLDSQIKKPLYQTYQRYNQKKKIFDYVRISIQLVLGIVAVLIAAYMPKDDSSNISIVLIAILSVLVAIISLGAEYINEKISDNTIKLQEKSEDYRPLVSAVILEKWRELEGLSNDVTDNEIKSKSSVIDTLYVNKYINTNEHNTLKEFLRLRNETVHAKTYHYSVEQINSMIKKVDIIINKIQNAI